MIDVAVQLSTLPHIIGAAFMPGLFVVPGLSATELGGLYFSSVSKLCAELSVSAGRLVCLAFGSRPSFCYADDH
jgi:hypothetical protein